MSRLLLVILAVVLPLSVAACAGPQGDHQAELRRSEQKWASQKIKDYRYTLRIGCF